MKNEASPAERQPPGALYIGMLLGYQLVQETMEDSDIRKHLLRDARDG